MDQKPGGVSAPIARIVQEYRAPSKPWRGVMTTWGDGTRSFELHGACKLQLCRLNNERLTRRVTT